MDIAKELEDVLSRAALYAGTMHHEYITPEHVLMVLTDVPCFHDAFSHCGGSVERLKSDIKEYLDQHVECLQEEQSEIQVSFSAQDMLSKAAQRAMAAGKEEIELTHLVCSIFDLKENYSAFLIESQGVEKASLLYELNLEETEDREESLKQEHLEILSQYTTCLNDETDHRTPLIGREEELQRTLQILCRRQKNNPLHIGEPGVGKTAIAYGLAKRIQEKKVPKKLETARIFSLDLGTLLAGTQFRGDFERRFKEIMDEILLEENPILYIDEIHNLVGAGAIGESSMDASNLLKPYLAEGGLRVIGSTTYEEYKKFFSKDKGLARRFQTIDIQEPTVDETIKILYGLKPYYEKFHHVRYHKGTLEHTAQLSSKYINERFLPDKAIDLMDEAGAYLELHPKDKKIQVVDKEVVEEVLSKLCNIPRQSVEAEESKRLSSLEARLKSQVFGQEEAVAQLVNAVKLSKSGLNDDNKPVCSLLFVGPTGVGKTELAKTAARELGIRLIRFDMSEYAEKHTVAKLIGSPAGYVGYEEGGLLTEAVRKTPHCILLLDEIEKAHPDIYNILLQVMDYATLTDNQGRKADFRNVILIMTSNAGADKASKAAMGFAGRTLNEDAITDEVKRVFRPEFRNRLDRIAVFHPMNQAMAEQIAQKQFQILADKAMERKVVLTMSKALAAYLCERGMSREYGAREIIRLINQEIKPRLVDQLLFGKLKKGGKCQVDYDGTEVMLKLN